MALKHIAVSMSDPETKPSYFTEGVLLALLSLFSYASAYAYEFGYCMYFGLPAELISVSVDVGLRAAFGIIFFSLGVVPYMNLPVIALGHTLTKPTKSLFSFIAPVLLVLILLYLIVFNTIGFSWIVIHVFSIILLFIFLYFVLPVLVAKWRDKEKRPISHHWTESFAPPSVDLYSLAVNLIGLRTSTFCIISIFWICLSLAAGYATARHTTFFTATASLDKLLIRKYNDTYVFKVFEPKQNRLRRITQLLSPADVAQLELVQTVIKDISVEQISILNIGQHNEKAPQVLPAVVPTPIATPSPNIPPNPTPLPISIKTPSPSANRTPAISPTP